MKVAIGHRIKEGPWGGGNSFVKNLSTALSAEGIEVVYNLSEPNLDFIIMTDPRPRSPNVAFAAGSILKYLKKNPNSIVIHRINECDERKDTKTMNFRLRLSNYCADHTVFVGSWLKKLPLTYRQDLNSQSVILNGADQSLFSSQGYTPWSGKGPIKLVTHHWGGNWKKGFDIYSHLDNLLGDSHWKDIFSFAYIGNVPKGFIFKNAQHVAPLSGQTLVKEIKKHHVYITASVNEPGGNHQIEGGLCGLPLMYRQSGCMPEYCTGFGVAFEGRDIESAIKGMREEYSVFLERMPSFPHTAERTTSEWIGLLKRLDKNRSELIRKRNNKRSYLVYWLNQLVW